MTTLDIDVIPRPITRAQFEMVRPMLEHVRKHTRPRTHDLYDVLCLIIHRAQHRLAWRSLPGDIPWRTVHEYMTIWTMPQKDGKPSFMSRVLDVLNLSIKIQTRELS